jgi:hypothetical protein
MHPKSTAILAPVLLLSFLSGCGAGTSKVDGVVTLDGQPVSGATVVFTSEDGANTASGLTDDAGKFSLAYSGKPDVPNGGYKVTVTKTAIVEGQSPALAGEGGPSKDYLKSMKTASVPKQTTSAPLMPGMPGYRPPSSTAGGSGAGTELPAIYANPKDTPLSVKVPVEGDLKLELKSK